MGEKFSSKPRSTSTETVWKQKKTEAGGTAEKMRTILETVRADNMAILARLDTDVGGNDYMHENGERFASYRALRNYALSMIDRADRFQKDLDHAHDTPEEEQN